MPRVKIRLFENCSLRIIVLLLSLFFANSASAEVVSVPFADGFVGTIGNNTQEADNVTLFTTANIEGSFFAQTTSTGVFTGQGNDVPGTLRLRYGGAIYDVDGRIAWQIKNRVSSGSGTELFGFIPNIGQNVTIGALTITSTSNLGLTVYAGPTLAQIKPTSAGNSAPGIDDGEDVKGDASNVGILDALNAYLAANEANNAVGPVTVDSQTTSDTTPIVTGEVTLNTGSGEYLLVIIDNKIYTASNGLTVTGNQWSIQIPDANQLSLQTYSVEAQIYNSGGWLLSDSTNN